MILADVNFFPVVVAALIQFVFGWFWYSPKAFGHAWMNGMGYRKEECSCVWYQWVGGFAVSLLMAWVFAALLDSFNINDPVDGAWFGFWIWLGFGVTKFFSGFLWTKENFSVFLINSFHYLISLIFFGIFLTSWR